MRSIVGWAVVVPMLAFVAFFYYVAARAIGESIKGWIRQAASGVDRKAAEEERAQWRLENPDWWKS